jgi:hypothetical protein
MAKWYHYYHRQAQQLKMPGAKVMQLLLLSWHQLAADAEHKGG